MPEELRFTTAPAPCPYLPAEVCQMKYRLVGAMDGEQYAALLNRGWRRFGCQFFRPRCPACAKCRSLRVKVAEFRPSKAQRRALKRNENVQLQIRPAGVSPAHLRLYNDYHAFMATEKGWSENEMTAEDYAAHFLGGRFAFAYEFLYWLDGALVGVGLVDLTRQASSSVYFYHAPAVRERSLGVFSMLQELAFARSRGIPHHHLGYWVPECASMAYKGTYRPAELLLGYPQDGEEPLWVEEKNWVEQLNDEEPGMIL